MAAFFSQFGENDFYTNLVLEVLFEELYGKTSKAIPIPCEERQEGDESFKHFPLQGMPANADYRLVPVKITKNPRERDSEDYT